MSARNIATDVKQISASERSRSSLPFGVRLRARFGEESFWIRLGSFLEQEMPYSGRMQEGLFVPTPNPPALTLHPIAKLEDVPPGKMVGADVGGERILVANVDGEFFAMRAKCNHMGGPLDRGTLEKSVVTCPLHGSKWDVKTGALVQFTRPLPPEPTYRVHVEGGQISVEA